VAKEEPRKRKSMFDTTREELPTGRHIAMPAMAPTLLQETRQARRLYVGNVPLDCSPEEIIAFLNEAMIKAELTKWAGPPINQAVHQAQGFLFIELRDPEEATAMLMYDGVIYKDRQLKVRRPTDYTPAPSAASDPATNPKLHAAINGLAKIEGVVTTNVEDGPNKLFLGNIANHLGPEQIKELVEYFGELKAFHLLVDNNEIGKSKGCAFLEYTDPEVTDQAIAALHGLDLCGRPLTCERSCTEAGRNQELENRLLMRGGNLTVQPSAIAALASTPPGPTMGLLPITQVPAAAALPTPPSLPTALPTPPSLPTALPTPPSLPVPPRLPVMPQLPMVPQLPNPALLAAAIGMPPLAGYPPFR